MKKRRIRHVPETKYCIEGPASFDGLWDNICEYICAYDEPQAFGRLALKLERERGQAVFFGSDCEISTVEILPPDKQIMPGKQIILSK